VTRLTRAWLDEVATGGGFVLSGVGVLPLLAYLGSAANEPGRTELLSALGAGDNEARAAAASLVGASKAAPAVHLAVGLWLRHDIPLAPWWQANVPTGLCHQLDEAEDNAQRLFDEWVAEGTAGLIGALPGAVGAGALMALASAVTIRTRWKEPFEAGLFTPQAGPWSRRRLAGCERRTADRSELRVVSTPLGPVTVLDVEGADDVSVELVMGGYDMRPSAVFDGVLVDWGEDAVTSGPDLEEGACAPGVMVGLHCTEAEPVLVAQVPRFSVTAEHDLLAHPEVFGLGAVTDATRGHFPLLSTFPLAVQAAKQVMVASFTELGFEAAAVTYAALAAGGVPPLRPHSIGVCFDRPFGFVARLRSSGLVLAAGWVAEPEAYRFVAAHVD
jgi:hypothetical protein